MFIKFKTLPGRFLIWRVKHVSSKSFILILSVIVGITSGLTALLLKTAVFKLRDFLIYGIEHEKSHLFLLVYPSIGIILTLILRKFIIRDSIKHNISSILHAISKRNSLMKAHKVFSSMLGGVFTAGFGGSIGLESPIISSGAAIGSNLGRILHLNYKQITLLLACGSAGAIAAIFNTPIAGIVFALEVLMIDLTRFSLIPLLMSSVSGAITTKLFYDKEILFEFAIRDAFTSNDIPFFILLGIVCGVVSVYFTKVFLYIEEKFENIKSHGYRLLIGGSIIGLLIFIFPPLFGEGFQSIKVVFEGNYSQLMEGTLFNSYRSSIPVLIVFFICLVMLKVVATASTLGAGGIGGIFAPSLFTGAIAGFLFAHILNLSGFHISELNFALVGMGSVLGGVLSAPLTGIFLIAEITTGYELIVPLMLSTTISFVTVKFLVSDSIVTWQLARKGELITHHKDKAVLRFMNLSSVIEKDIKTISIDASLGELVKLISKSNRNIFPVVDKNETLLGIILLDQVREIMFQPDMYDNTYVRNLMISAPTYIEFGEAMEEVIRKFNDSNAWNLPVLEKGKYLGMVSKSKLFSAYRKQLLNITEE
jgi:CIC family chloride channel protein